jgi:putative membrane protein
MNAGVPEQHGAGSGNRHLLLGLVLAYSVFWVWLAIDPLNRRDWLLENLLVLTLIPLLLLTYRRFEFSLTSYCLIGLFLVLHAFGAHYTYAEVPLGYMLQDLWGLSRNPFDRIAHFAYGALLVSPIRELLVRQAGLRGWWSYALPICVVLAQSGFFEVLEAIVAVIVSPELGNIYLGTQGDEWDAQHDMAAALAGSILTMCIVFASSMLSKSKANSLSSVTFFSSFLIAVAFHHLLESAS